MSSLVWFPRSLSSAQRNNLERWTAEIAQLAVQQQIPKIRLQTYVFRCVKKSGVSTSGCVDAVNSYNSFYDSYNGNPSNMPAQLKAFGRKGKGKANAGGIGSKARNNKTYGGIKSSDWDSALAQAVSSNVAKQIGKSIETQYSQAQIQMSYQIPTVAAPIANPLNSWAMVGLNQNFIPITAPAGATNAGQITGYTPNPVWHQMLWFNLSTLSQVRSSSSNGYSGYRQGFKINPSYLKVRLTGWVSEMGSDAVYHLMIARRKDGAGAGLVQTPAIVYGDVTGLYKPITDGPCAVLGAGDSATVADYHYISKMRRNQDAWSFPEGCHKKLVVTQNESAELPGITNTTAQATNVDIELYKSLSGSWDFTSQNSSDKPVLKGGDYYAFVWREGPTDTSMQQYLKVYMELAFKDA